MSGCKHEGEHFGAWNMCIDGEWRGVGVDGCEDCGAWLSLGEARDTIDTWFEIEAARLAAVYAGHGGLAEATPIVWAGWFDEDPHGIAAGGRNDTWQAGALARVIHEHTPLDEREEEK